MDQADIPIAQVRPEVLALTPTLSGKLFQEKLWLACYNAIGLKLRHSAKGELRAEDAFWGFKLLRDSFSWRALSGMRSCADDGLFHAAMMARQIYDDDADPSHNPQPRLSKAVMPFQQLRLYDAYENKKRAYEDKTVRRVIAQEVIAEDFITNNWGWGGVYERLIDEGEHYSILRNNFAAGSSCCSQMPVYRASSKSVIRLCE